MQLDRLVLDVLDWIRRSLFWRSNRQVKQQPYTILQMERGWRGMLKQVKRDTPRAVRTWIFTPYPTAGSPKSETNGHGFISRKNMKDYHICLDHLFPIREEEARSPSGQPPRRGRLKPNAMTHRLMVLEASRYLNQDGSYDTSTLFCREYDFTRGDKYLDRWAIAVVDELAKIVGNSGIEDMDWHTEIELSRKRFVGSKSG
jgi:hypothetical protein